MKVVPVVFRLITRFLLITLCVFSVSGVAYSQSTHSNKAIRIGTYDSNNQLIGTGSGFLVIDENLVVTNKHVVEGGVSFGVFVPTDSGDGIRVVNAEIRRLFDIDLAILKTSESLPFERLILSSAQPDQATPVTAIGFPEGADLLNNGGIDAIRSTVNLGVVSRVLNQNIQHDAPINPGNSGGPLVDNCGYALGVNTALARGSQGIFIAISSKVVINRLNEAGFFPPTTSSFCNGGFADVFRGPNFLRYLFLILLITLGSIYYLRQKRLKPSFANDTRFQNRIQQKQFQLTKYISNILTTSKKPKSDNDWDSGTVFFEDIKSEGKSKSEFDRKSDSKTSLWNNDEIVAKNTSLKFFHNGNLLYSSSLEDFPSGGVGIGRDRAKNEIVIDEASVSRRHAIINVIGSKNDSSALVSISDLNSSNGTRVGKVDVSSAYDFSEDTTVQIGEEYLDINFVQGASGKKISTIKSASDSITDIHRKHGDDLTRDRRFSNTEIYQNRSWRLSGIDEDGEILSHDLFGDPSKDVEISIGRENCDFIILNSSVSKRHACIIIEAGLPPSIMDLDSTNGTSVDDVIVSGEPYSLYNSKNIKLGSLTLELSVL